MQNEKKFVCIVCPTGCEISVKYEIYENGNMSELQVLGNKCKRGEAYVIQEITNPTRVITSTVALCNCEHKRLPVKTSSPINKSLTLYAVRLLDNIKVTPPISCGQVILSDILGTGINFVATREIR